MENDKKIIEVNGVKLEVDLSQAKVISHYRIGDQVKVLHKEYSNYSPYAGVIVGFDNFKERPTIIVAYIKTSYDSAEIKMVYIHKDTEDVEICPITDGDINFDKAKVMELFDRKILVEEEKLKGLKNQKNYFIERFGEYFEKEKGGGAY